MPKDRNQARALSLKLHQMGVQAAVSTHLYMSLDKEYTKTRRELDITRAGLAHVVAQRNNCAVRLTKAERTNEICMATLANVQTELRLYQNREGEQEREIHSLRTQALRWETNAQDVSYESQLKTDDINRLEAQLKQAKLDLAIYIEDMQAVRRKDKEDLQTLQVQYAEQSDRERVQKQADLAALQADYDRENASLRTSLEKCESKLAKELVKKRSQESIIRGCQVTLFESRRESREQYAELSRKHEILRQGTEKSLKRQADLQTAKEAAEVKVQEVERDLAEMHEHVRESDLLVLGVWATKGSGCKRP